MNIKGDIAIIGMSGRFPGADDVSGFWDNLRAGRDSIRTLSDEELRAAGVSEAELADPEYVKAAATLNGVDRFDPAFFRISPREAELIDPQIRLLLQCAWETLEDAGRAGKGPQNIGVFAGAGGVATSYFAQYINLHERFDKLTAGATHLGNDKDFLSTYLSYKLNLTGPSMTVQTACSTSLVALHQARLSLLSGECDMALAGGVSVRVPHGHGYQYKDGYIFSRGGRVRSFDADADGVVFGSGLGLVLIKRLEDALRDGDAIHAIVKGSAIGNDGKGKMSYAASSAKGQVACIRAALANAGVDAASIGLVETHGTGTAMGDPEEVKALVAAFKEHTDAKGYCALGAVKANVGHLEAAAGVVGLIKAALAVKHGAIPPMAHYRAPNPRIKFDNSPFYIDPAGREWRQGKGPRRAAVNSLGVGGTNAFAIVEQHLPARRARGKARAQAAIFPLSARTDESLRAYALKLADFLDGPGAGLEPADVAFTLQEGREAMECRAAFAASSLAELSAALRAFAEDAAQPDLQGAAAAWCAREELDWSAHRTGPAPRRVHLPTYVFARERCWIDPAPVAAPTAAQLHPLLHANTSDLREHRYSTALRGDEFFLRDHRLRTAQGASDARKVLPGVAYLEMAHAAMQRALPAPAEDGGWRLRDLVWVQPVVVDAPRAIDIALLADEGDGDTLAFEVFSDEDTLHCQGQGRWEAQPRPAPLDLAALGAGLGEGWQADALYPAFAAMGLEYGPAHRPIVSTRQDRDSLLATMRLPSAAQAGADEYVLHPSLLDGALQAATALIADLREPPTQPLVPFALDELRVWAACETDMVAWVRRAPGAQRLAKFDIDLCDAQGRICAQLRGFVARAMGKDSSAALLATQTWDAADAAAETAPAGDRRAVLFGFADLDLQALAGAVSLQPLPQGNAAERYTQLASTCFETLREVLRERPSAPVLVQFVLPAHAENEMFAGCSGLLKTATLENPLLRAQLLFVAPDIDAAGLSRLLNAEGAAPDVLVRHAGGQRSVARWRLLENDVADAAETGGAFKDDGVYLITGGLGGLGVLFAREILAATTRATVLLSGRAGVDEVAAAPDKQALLASLRAAGGRVEYRRLDLGDAANVSEGIAAIVREHGRLNGILHSAGMVADEFILKKSAATFAAVLAPKVAGSVHLDAATRDLDLDFIALFSSLGSALGNLGQADYAAANGFLDEFAAQRNALAAAGQRRGRTVAIRWPLWREGGMQLRADDLERLHEATGIRPMRTRTGLAMFYRSLAGHHDQTVVMEGDPARMRVALGLDRAAAAPAPAVATAADAVATGDLRERTEDYLRRQLSVLLKLPAEKVDPAAPLEDYGIDSILALDLTKALERSFGPLAKTLFFEYLSLRELAGYFVAAHAPRLRELFTDADSAVAAPVQPQAAAAVDDSGTGRRRLRAAAARRAEPARGFAGEPIAIVGLSGRYPQARDIDAYWDVLREGRDCIVEIPPERWDWREYYSEDRSQPGRHYSKWGGFIEGVDEFDARFFNISPREADTIDPQERLFLQQAWMAIEDAGYTRQSLQMPGPGGLPAPVGVYAGVMYGEYQLLGAEASLLGQPMGFASNPASIANRVSYALNLHGPSMVVDTMCSSSLTAIHVACQDLKLGRTSLAIAGGVNVTIHPNKYLMLSAGQFISGDGHCQSFGEGGDGYIPGEGVGAVVLKRLSDAQRDGDRIYGVIRGSALSHGGKTNGYTVPNPQAQAGAIRQALADAGVDARQVSYLEAHGTGTKLGDPIEIAALTKVFREHTDASGYCLIGSAKSNIGHCEAAAGIAGLTKVLLQLKHRAIVPSLHSARLNPHIDFDATPFVVNQRLRAWDAPRVDGRELPRIAGISSFGAGGSNAHLLIEEYVPPVAVEPAEEAWIVPLSARTAEQLQEKARDLLVWLRADAGASTLASIAQTLQVGREAMNERLGVLAASTDALGAALQAFVEGREPSDVRRGQARSAAPAPSAADVEAWTAARDLAPLLAAWVDGQALDWARLYPQAQPRLSLPAYPFARQRHWIDVRAGARGAAKRAAALHPLLHRNRSDLLQHSYSADFAGDEWFLDGEPGARSLSAAACLEMARAAFAAALPEQGEPGMLELREIAWARPGVVAAGQILAISLFDRRGDALRFEIHAAGADAAVHCQGLAERVRAAIAPRVDVQALGRDAPATLIRLQLAAEQGDERDAYGLHPALAQAALSAAGAGRAPVAVTAVRIASGIGRPVWAWVRPAAGDAFDIDLCDENGAVSAQLQGVRYALAAAQARTAAVTHSDPAAAATQAALPPAVVAAPRRVAYAAARSAVGGPSVFAPAALKKPDSVALVAQAADLPTGSTATAKPTVALAPRTDSDASISVVAGSDAADDVQLFDHGDGVFAIRIEANDEADTLTPQRIERLLAALRAVEAQPAARALVLCGTPERFLAGGRDAHNAAAAQGLYGAIAGFACPVIAAVRGAAHGAGFLAAALCDFMLVGETTQCGFTDLDGGVSPAAAETFLRQRFGTARADDLLYLDRVASGGDLRDKGWRCPVAPAEEIEARAFALAAELAAKPQESLRLLKRHLARELIDAAAGIAGSSPAAAAAALAMPEFALASPHLAVRAAAPGVAIATLRAGDGGFDADATLAALRDLAAELAGPAQCRSLVVTSEHRGFLPLAADQGELALAWRQALTALPCAVTTVLDSDAAGLGWFAGWCGEVCVHRADARYSALGLPAAGALADAAATALSRHLDADEAAQVLLGIDCDGDELRRRFGALHVAQAGQELDAALRAATALAALPADALAGWKRNAAANAVEPSEADEFAAAQAALVPGPVALDSAVVSATAHADGVLEIRLADRDARNLFSDAFSHGLRAAFAHVEASGAYKAVVLTGYDNYFSTGGTRETLLAIHQGRAKFTDNPLFRLPLDCAVPVVAAIQGHAIGAGWALGMFADVAVLAEESHYASPYMGYGFTPGAGATLAFPHAVGHDLARETLLSAREYTGADLAARGLSQRVLPRERVFAAALAAAQAIARNPRERLLALKRRRMRALQPRLEETLARELAMHERTFVGQAETLTRIEGRFGAESASAAPASAAVAVAPQTDLPAVSARLRQMLSHELRLAEHEIGEDELFVDLGLDSITGVTWVRRINEAYGTAIEAIKVYSYPTLAKLAQHVLDEAGAGAPAAAAVVASTAAAAAATTAPATAAPALDSVVARLRASLAHELRLGENEIGADELFVDLGLDSITGVTWVRRINEAYGTAIEAIKVYSYPTLGQLARFVAEEAAKVAAPAAPVAPATDIVLPAIAATAADDSVVALRSWRGRAAAQSTGRADFADSRIAVIGMTGRFAGADDLQAFWRNLAEGRDSVGEIPADRWDVEAYFQAGDIAPGKSYSRWMGALDGYDRFDAAFFNISPREARSMDPQQRLFLQACWHGIEHAGYDPRALAGSRCGVFAGCAANDYHQLSQRERLSGQGFTGAAPSILAARISYFLDLHGPSLSIDTACSSSLVAIANACDSLASGACDLALAGGVNVMAGPSMHIMTAQVGMLSPRGRCFAFDERADGIAPGEGVGVVVLKRLADAERDGDCIYGVVEGWGANQDGKTNGITAPNADSQARLQREVYRRFGIDPAGIGLIEAHGTGTALGDPIEVAGLKASFADFTQRRDYCALGSVKSNIGHCLAAAGVSGFIKALLALRHAQLPPAAQFERLNTHIALQGSPFYVNQRLRDWPSESGAPRRAAINSFGFSGTNAHAVVAEYVETQAAVLTAGEVLLPLSARTAAQLQQRVRDLLAFVEADPALDLRRVAHTLQTGREAMSERLAVTAGSVGELRERLHAWLERSDSGVAIAGVWRGDALADKSTLTALAAEADFQAMIGKWFAQQALPRLADLWAKGLALDWRRLYPAGAAPRRIGLPVYPFARERYWIDAETDGIEALPAASAALHPLLHVNISDLRRQAYRTVVRGNERRLAGEQATRLPQQAYLDMARAAVADALPELRGDDGAALRLSAIEWSVPDGFADLVTTVAPLHGGAIAFEIAEDGGDARVHCRGVADAGIEAAPPVSDTAMPEPVVAVQPPAVAAPASTALPLERLQRELRESLAEALLMQASDVNIDKSFTELGLDSILGVEWVKQINRGYGTELAATRVYDYPSVRALAAYLHPQVRGDETAVAPAPVAAAPVAISQATAPVASVSREDVQAELRASLAEALLMQVSDVNLDKSFTELGLDSILGVEWVKQINRRYGTELAATRVYDYPSVRALAAYLHPQVRGDGTAVVAAPVAAAPVAVAQAAAPSVSISREAVQAELRASLAEALLMQVADVNLDKSFTELGLDSILGVEWVKQINRRYGTELAATRVYDYPSVRALATYIHPQLQAEAGVAAPVPAATQAVAPPQPAASPAPRAATSRASLGHRFAARGGFAFAPKYDARSRQLYFYSPHAEGDYEADGEFAVVYRLSPDDNICLREHVVFGEHLLPTDAYIDLVLSACRSYFDAPSPGLRQIAIANPLLGRPGEQRLVRVVFRRSGEELQFFVKSRSGADVEDETLHMQGFLTAAAAAPAAPRFDTVDADAGLERAQIPTNAGRYYAPLERLRFGASAAIGTVRPRAHEFAFAVDPFALYGGLCTVINYAAHLAARHYGASEDQFLPHRIGRIDLAGELGGGDYRCLAELTAMQPDAFEFRFSLVDSDGRIALTVEDIVLRRVAAAGLRRTAQAAPRALPAPATKPRAAGEGDKVAIIGMSCRYPMSENLDAFWDNLLHGRDCVGEVPAGRWFGDADWFHSDPRHPRTSYSKWAGLLDRIDAFDPLFFGISPAEAELIDPQQRIFLEECWKAIEHAGYAPGALSGEACGVYVGCASGDYARVLNGAGQDTAGAAFMGTSSAILAARIAYYLNLKGPALAIDTACSSSLVAVHLACDSIRNGENRMALVGGINLLTTPIGHILTSQVGMPSRDGRCAAFDASANGIVFSEGCGVLLLKSLAQAQRDGDEILGVIEGSGINQDGKTNGITAPSSNAQERLLRQVYDRFGVDPRRIGYVEAHGTATALGDPIEVNALGAVFGAAGAQTRSCVLGSVKSNIGHTGFAAGVAGMIKALLCLRQRTLVPSIHYLTPNPHIDFAALPFYVGTERRDWDSAQPRVATVSSFGFSGTNAHVVVAEYPAAAAVAPPAPPPRVAVPLSARAAPQLRQRAVDLLAFVRAAGPELDLARLAGTLQLGRDAMEHRAGFVAVSAEDLAAKLQDYLDGKRRNDGIYRGPAVRDEDALAMFAGDDDMSAVIAQWFARGNLGKLMDLWVRGLDLDWSALYAGSRPKPMALPTYPFARERCWPDAVAPARTAAAAALHPLLHRNASDLEQQRYLSRFDGSEFFLADHRVQGVPVLPAVAYLEMARAAILDAVPGAADPQQLHLRHIAWQQPIAVAGEREVELALSADENGKIQFEVLSDDGGGERLHCLGHAVWEPAPLPAALDLAALRQRMTRGRLDAAALYPRFAAMGLGYGPALQGIVAVEHGDGEALLELRLPDAAGDSAAYVLHPSAMDSALQGSIGLIAEAVGHDAPALPFALESLRVLAPCAPRMQAWVRYAPGGVSPQLVKVDIDLCGDDGRVCVQMRGFSSRPIDAGGRIAAPVEAMPDENENRYLSIIQRVLDRELSIDEAVELG